MAINKVEYGNNVLIDLSNDTLTSADQIRNGYVGHLRDGTQVTGTYQGGSATTRYITLFDNEVEIISDNPNYIWINNQPEAITVGDRYRVTWDNTVYIVTAVNDATIGDWYGNTFGNASILGGADDPSNAPFVAYKTRWSTNEMQLSTNETGTIDLKIEKIVYGDNLNLQSKTATPTESTQTITFDNSYDALDQVTVNPIPSSYIIPSGSVSITQNGNVDVTDYASAIVNVSGGSGNFKKGTVTIPEDYTTAGNRVIVSMANIGFTPKCFYMWISNKSAMSGKAYTILRASFESDDNGGYIRNVVRYSNSSNSLGGNQNVGNWTTQTNYHLYNDGTNIYYRTTTGYNLFKDSVYNWVAVG